MRTTNNLEAIMFAVAANGSEVVNVMKITCITCIYNSG